TAGLGGVARHGCVALVEGFRAIGVCQQERVTRVRNAGFNATGLPDEALNLLLRRLGRTHDDIGRYVLAETDRAREEDVRFERIGHHLAHACTAYLTSHFSSAAIVVCDEEAPKVSLWEGNGPSIHGIDWPWRGPGFADVYAMCARAFGFESPSGAQRFEALARLRPDTSDERLTSLLTLEEGTALVF